MRASAQADGDPEARRVLTTAVLRASSALGVSQQDLSRILGVSPASISRMPEARTIDPASKEGELALLFLRVFRSLDAMVGGHEAKARAWFSAPNKHVRGVPAERVQSVEGLIDVANYLDAMRGTL